MISEHTVDRFKKNDRQAFEDIYKEYWQGLTGFLKKHTAAEDVEDIAHDTFIRLWENRISIRPDSKMFGYICATGLNITFNRYRHNVIVKTHLLKECMQANIEQKLYSPEEEYIAGDLLQHINIIIKEKLTEQQLKIFCFRRQGFTYKEITRKLDIKESTVETHIRRINKILRKYLNF
jgi:RNA polymerase sigma-70 factor (ECF subfamily)